MARFGKDLVRSLTQPSFGADLSNIGMLIGSLGSDIREKRKQEAEREGLINLENQLRQTATAGAEAAQAGNVEAINAQIESIDEQLKAEKNPEKRKSLTDAYNVLIKSRNLARQQTETLRGQEQEVGIREALRGGELSSRDGNIVGISTARAKLAGLLETEQNEELRSKIFNAMDSLDKELEAAEGNKRNRDISDLVKAEDLYAKLEAKGGAKTENESKVMSAVKQRIDQLKGDPDVARAVKMQRNQQELDMLTKENELLNAQETQAIAILSSLDPESNQYAAEVEKAKRNKLGGAVDKVEKAQLEAKKAQLDYDKLNEEMNPRPLTAEQLDYGKKFGLKFNEGNSRKEIVADWEMYKNLLQKVADSGTQLALRDVKPLDDAGAKATVTVALRNLERQGDLSFAKDIFLTDLEDELKNLSQEDEQYLVALVTGKTPIEAEQEILEFVQDKFPEAFERTQTEKTAEAEYEESLRDAMQATFEKYPELDPNDPVDQAKVMEAANKQLRQAMGVPTASEMFFGSTPEYDQRRGKRQ